MLLLSAYNEIYMLPRRQQFELGSISNRKGGPTNGYRIYPITPGQGDQVRLCDRHLSGPDCPIHCQLNLILQRPTRQSSCPGKCMELLFNSTNHWRDIFLGDRLVLVHLGALKGIHILSANHIHLFSTLLLLIISDFPTYFSRCCQKLIVQPFALVDCG